MLINPPGATNLNSLKIGFNAQLQARTQLRDIYGNVEGLYNKTTQSIVNAIYMKVDEKAASGSNSVRITLQLPLTGAAVEGNARMVGTEEAPSLKNLTIYRNNWGKAVSTEEYGIRYLDQKYLDVYGKHVQNLGTWANQYKGRSVRTAILERWSPNLLQGDTAPAGGGVCVQEWNPHFYIAGVKHDEQPTYSSNMATYTNNIVSALFHARGDSFDQYASCSLNMRYILNLVRYAYEHLIMPLDINGNQAYILTSSPFQLTMNSDPTWGANTMGAWWTAVTAIQNPTVQNWIGLQGVVKTAAGVDVYIVSDMKQPTLLMSGSSEPFGMTAGYVFEGDNMLPLNLNNRRTRDTAFLLGKSALWMWEPEALHMVEQDEEYHRIYGNGCKGVWGMGLPIFDQQNPDNTSREYYGSVVGVLDRPDYV